MLMVSSYQQNILNAHNITSNSAIILTGSLHMYNIKVQSIHLPPEILIRLNKYKEKSVILQAIGII